jgi:hypothetical protein
VTRVRFDQALEWALAFAAEHREVLGGDMVVVRDIVGRIRLACAARPKNAEELAAKLHLLLGAFSVGKDGVLLFRDEMMLPHTVFDSRDLAQVSEGVRLLERQVTGADWTRGPLPRRSITSARVTFFGIKGGVGRSTALVAVARHLAEQGERVLVIDLDLESPGVTTSLLPADALPSFGICDWFVEDDVGQADVDLLREMVGTSPLAAGTRGEIRVVPALGTTGQDHYAAKLSRLYAAPPGKGDTAERLGRMVDALEAAERPTITLLDSRAGIHDIAAIAVTRLGATAALLFAIDTPQTWMAYRLLFAAWHKDAKLLRGFRDGLRVVAAQIPETGRPEYLERLLDHSSRLFSDYIYESDPDEVDAPSDAEDALSAALDRFNFDISDEGAPHAPVPIYWARIFQDWDPTAEQQSVTPEQVVGSFGPFFKFFDELLVREVVDT